MKTETTQDILAARIGDSVPSATSCSHLILRAYKFRIYPDAEQRILLAKHFGCCRFVYNHFLAMRQTAYKERKERISLYDTHHMVAEMRKEDQYSWLKEVYGHSLQAALRHLDAAYKRVFRAKDGGFPRFHSKHDRQSVMFPDNVRVVDGALKLPKFKTEIKMKMHRSLGGRICHATISRTAQGKYYVSILCEEDCAYLPPVEKTVGIDLGIKDMAVCSDGERVANPKFLEKAEKRLKHLQRQVSRKKKGGNRRRKARLRLSRHLEKVRNRRMDYIHKVTRRIVGENQAVCVEDLNVRGMMANHHLAKSVGSVSFAEIVRQLEYKCRWYGRGFVKVPRFYPSSKTCHHCGHVNRELTLKDREWVCHNCGNEIDRDLNAAKNIEAKGLEILSGCGAQSDVKRKGGEAAA